jgi:hypothetical protein
LKSPSPINRRSNDRFRNKCRRISLKPGRLRKQEGAVTMNDRDAFAEGERAARKNIPAEANPYQDGSDEHALWSAGHEKVASAIEARESEGS